MGGVSRSCLSWLANCLMGRTSRPECIDRILQPSHSMRGVGEPTWPVPIFESFRGPSRGRHVLKLNVNRTQRWDYFRLVVAHPKSFWLLGQDGIMSNVKYMVIRGFLGRAGFDLVRSNSMQLEPEVLSGGTSICFA